MAGAASQAGDADLSRASGLTSGLQRFVNVHRVVLYCNEKTKRRKRKDEKDESDMMPQWQCISFCFVLFVCVCVCVVFFLYFTMFKLFILLFKFMSTQGRIFSQRLYSINLLVFNLQSVRLESAKVNSMINLLSTHIKI